MSEAAASMIERFGQSITYRRTTANSYNVATGENTPTTSDTTVTASVRMYKSKEIAGLVQVGDREVRIPAASLSFTPKAEDTVVIDAATFTVVGVHSRTLGNVAAMHILQVRGGNG